MYTQVCVYNELFLYNINFFLLKEKLFQELKVKLTEEKRFLCFLHFEFLRISTDHNVFIDSYFKKGYLSQ